MEKFQLDFRKKHNGAWDILGGPKQRMVATLKLSERVMEITFVREFLPYPALLWADFNFEDADRYVLNLFMKTTMYNILTANGYRDVFFEAPVPTTILEGLNKFSQLQYADKYTFSSDGKKYFVSSKDKSYTNQLIAECTFLENHITHVILYVNHAYQTPVYISHENMQAFLMLLCPTIVISTALHHPHTTNTEHQLLWNSIERLTSLLESRLSTSAPPTTSSAASSRCTTHGTLRSALCECCATP